MRCALFLCAVVVFMAASPAAADCVARGTYAACENVKLGQLYVNSSGVYLETSGTETRMNNDESGACVATSNIYLWLPKTHGNYDAVMSTLLSAKLSNATVTVRLSADTSAGRRCNVSYLRLL